LQGLTAGTTALLQGEIIMVGCKYPFANNRAGTGGVSMFALLICLAAGIKPIITSSSDAKLERLKQLNPAVSGINYKSSPDIVTEALELSGGKGVDYVLNNIGVSSIPTDLQMLRKRGGRIALVGFLEGFEAGWSPSTLMTLVGKEAHMQ
jgi:NADPH:quinone reductase-like Zn-dependent oxidoreductase